MVSVERVLEYGKLPSEDSLNNFTDGKTSEIALQKIAEWPKTGKIKFNNVSVSYGGEFDYENRVLKDLSFAVKGGQKVR
jgi:ABC-type multidrug transport system fused ATPase/permease subunit